MFFVGRQHDPFGVIRIETVSAERTAVFFVRNEIGSAGRAVLFDEKLSVRLSFIGVSCSLQSECSSGFLRVRFFVFGEIRFAYADIGGYRGCVLRVDDFFQNDRTYAVVKQLIAAGVLLKSLGYAGSEVVFRIKLNPLRQLIVPQLPGKRQSRQRREHQNRRAHTCRQGYLGILYQVEAEKFGEKQYRHAPEQQQKLSEIVPDMLVDLKNLGLPVVKIRLNPCAAVFADYLLTAERDLGTA